MSAPSSRPPDTRATRLAPSPTGALHLGNARTFLVNWALARRNNWRVILRIDDLAGPRIKKNAAAAAINDLRWLGLDWELQPIYQSQRIALYRDAMRALANAGLAYPCELSRAEIESALVAPHAPVTGAAGEVRFPAELRPDVHPRDFDERDEARSWRFVVEPGDVRFTDTFAGPQSIDPAATIGDFVIWTKEREPAYQLATVVDDHLLGVTDIIRADDLLDSAARQLLLFRALKFNPEPTFMHLPLIIGPDGRRLAKRHGDTRISLYRDLGVPASRIIALLARWSGISDPPPHMTASEFADAFDPGTMPHGPVTFSVEDDQWLRAQS